MAHGEAHVYDLYRAETEVRRPDGSLLFADVLHIEPADGDPRSAAMLGGYDVVAALYVVTEAMAPAALVALLRDERPPRVPASSRA